MCASSGHATLLREQPSGRGKVIDNSRSVIDGSWSILIRRRSVIIITRYWRIVIQGLEHYRKKLGCPCQELHQIFRPGMHILLQMGGLHRMYRTTRPPVQDPIQESRIPSTTRTRQERIGDKTINHVCGVHLHRERPVSDLGGGKPGD